MASSDQKPDATKDDVKPPLMNLSAGRLAGNERETAVNAKDGSKSVNVALHGKAPRPEGTRPEKGK